MMIANSKALQSSAMYIGYLILKEIQKQEKDKVSIYDVSKALKKRGVSSSRQLVLGLSFLYSVNIVEFEEANIWVKK
ncbi:MAG: hypothetical protein HFI82_07910 [Eubacterium sp.]|jgi:hypothetical protein|nr:hypothetical protein [Eubacterium sp.]